MNNKYLILLCLIILLILLVLKKNKEEFSLISIENSSLKSDGIIGKSGTFTENDLVKEAINNILPELKKKNTHFDNQLSLHSLPKGSIILWGNSSIPSGWVLCDGTNRTPNLTHCTPICPGAGVKHKTRVGSTSKVSFKLNSNNMPRHNHTASISLSKKNHKHTGTTGSGSARISFGNDRTGANTGFFNSGHAKKNNVETCKIKDKLITARAHQHNFSTKESNMNITATAKINNYGFGKEKTVKIETLPYTYVSFIMKNY